MTCPALSLDDGGLADTLRAIDCRVGDGTAVAFSRLFGVHGTLMPALTLLLTLYVAIFAIGLLTGRTRLGIASLTPRMLTLGLVLTFATSWLAYQNVVWTLATGAPDEIATAIAGTTGSATDVFATRLDALFAAISEASHQTPAAAISAAGATASGATPGITLMSPQGMLWISGLMLLVGTLGVLVTAKVALAALLALGPLFIVLALFAGTRGLFEGWLKALVSTALVPLFTVLIGGATLSLIAPLLREALLDSSVVASRSAIALFLAACVYCALMVMVVRTATMLVASWRLPFDRGRDRDAAAPAPAVPAMQLLGPASLTTVAGERVRAMVAALPAATTAGAEAVAGEARLRLVTTGSPAIATPAAAAAQSGDRRLQGVGSRFRAAPAMPAKGRLS